MEKLSVMELMTIGAVLDNMIQRGGLSNNAKIGLISIQQKVLGMAEELSNTIDIVSSEVKPI